MSCALVACSARCRAARGTAAAAVPAVARVVWRAPTALTASPRSARLAPRCAVLSAECVQCNTCHQHSLSLIYLPRRSSTNPSSAVDVLRCLLTYTIGLVRRRIKVTVVECRH